MSATVPLARGTDKYQDRDPVARALAQELGLLVSSAHQVLVGQLARRTAAVIRAHLRAQATDRLLRWMEPIRAALAELEPEPLSAALIQEAQARDVEEDLAETIYTTDPCPEHLVNWRRKLDAQATTNLRLRMAIVRELDQLAGRDR